MFSLQFLFSRKKLPSVKASQDPITTSQSPPASHAQEWGGHMVLQTVRFVTDEERAAIMANLQKVLWMPVPTVARP